MMSRLRSLWRNLWRREVVDRDLDDEVRAVFDLLVDEKVKAGLSLERARRAATLELGRVDGITQQVREERAGARLDAIVSDIRYGARMLRANPGFTAVVVLSLAVGIGANSAIFAVSNAVLFRTLPVPEPNRLHTVRVESRLPMTPRVSYRFFSQLRDGFTDPNGLAAMSRVGSMRTQLGSGEPEPVSLQLVSGEFFSVLRLQPQLGRFLSPDDNRTQGAHPVAVISDAYWRRRFNAAPDALGREVAINGAPFAIVGVAPPGFSGAWLESPVDVWVPLMMQFEVKYTQNFSASNADMTKPWIPQEGLRWLELVLRADRLDGPEVAALNAVFQPVSQREAEQMANAEERQMARERRLTIVPFAHGSSALRTRFRAPLFALMGMVGFLLLLACANTANLLLARATSRQREMAVRLSIGASRPRIITQLLIESLLLGALAALVGLAIAPLVGELLVRMTIGVDAGAPLPFSVGVDGRVLAFTVAITLMTSFLFGFAPAWHATDLSLSTALKTAGRGTHHGARLNLSKMLVVAQVALSLLLAVGAGLFLRSFGNLAALPLGFEQHVIWASITPTLGGYQPSDLPGLHQRIIERAEALPGVESATIAMCGLMTGCRANADGIAISGYTAQPGEQVLFQENRIGPRYFDTVGMTLVAGRDFTPLDADRPVVIVNEAAARKYFQGREAVGQYFGYDKPTLEIVGVVRDARVNAVREAAVPMAFYPLGPQQGAGSMHVRTSGDAEATGAALRRALRELEPNLPVGRPTTITTLAAATLRQDRLIARLTAVLGVLALALAALGVYGLMSYAVRQRTAELGIRFALGAPRPRVLWMVFRESLMLTGAGVIVGVPLVIVSSRLIQAMLFDVSPNDPAIVGAAILVLVAVGAASSYLPAWRASRVDPLTALRTE